MIMQAGCYVDSFWYSPPLETALPEPLAWLYQGLEKLIRPSGKKSSSSSCVLASKWAESPLKRKKTYDKHNIQKNYTITCRKLEGTLVDGLLGIVFSIFKGI